MTEPAKWRHADPCTCWNDPEYGPIIGADCIRAMYVEALEALNHPKPQTADSVTSATPDSGFTVGHLERRTSATWKVGDTGLVKKCPGGHLFIGANAAAKLGMTAGTDGWAEFTVVPDEPAEPITITEFLLARIAEDEAAVESRGDQPHAIHRSDIVGTFRDGCADCLGLRGRARVLDECASKRAIIELAEHVESMDHQIANEWGGLAGTADSILSALAAVYEHHPDYQKEWGNGG